MPAYSFQERFVPWVKDGSKRQTIRSRRKKGFAKKGDTLYLYFAMRTKYCKKLKETTCKDARTIIITSSGIVLLSGRMDDVFVQIVMDQLKRGVNKNRIGPVLTTDEANQLAWDDGFRPDGSTAKNPKGCFALMLRWWKQTHELPFVGDIIYW